METEKGRFIAEAVEQCTKTVTVYRDAMPTSGKSLAQGVEWLSKAHCIRLDVPLIPFGLEERRIAQIGEYGYGLDAPWTITAIEYEHGGTYDVEQDYTRALSTRRIALCVAISDSMAPGLSQMQAAAPEEQWGSLLVWPVTYFDEKKEWEFSPGVVIIPREQAEMELALGANHFLALAHKVESFIRNGFKRDAASVDRPMTVRYQPMMPELCAKLGEDHSDKMIRESSMDALWVVLGSFTAMACQNVVIEKQSRALQVIDEVHGRQGLDPFRGKRAMRWNGKPVWTQTTKSPHRRPEVSQTNNT